MVELFNEAVEVDYPLLHAHTIVVVLLLDCLQLRDVVLHDLAVVELVFLFLLAQSSFPLHELF